jgi:hypothetical protein
MIGIVRFIPDWVPGLRFKYDNPIIFIQYIDLTPNFRQLIREGREISYNIRHKAYKRSTELYVSLSGDFYIH